MLRSSILLFSIVIHVIVHAQFKAGITLPPVKSGKSKSIEALDVLFEKSIRDFNVPGMAVVILKDSTVLLSKGYGVKNMDTKEKVDNETLFAIASNTKAFTSAALATLVDQGKIKWNDKVRQYLPEFMLYSPYVSEEMTIRDLLCHRSGLATFSGDLIWYGTQYSREEVIRRARFLSPKYGFREAYGYQNIMFLAAGEIVAKVSGMSWDEYVRTTFFEPLNMTTTNTSIRSFSKNGNIASPHNEVAGRNIPIAYVNWDNIGPAGSINSNVTDLSQWLRLQLGWGSLHGKTYWKRERSNEMWEVNTPRPVSEWQKQNMPGRHFSGYGLGWDIMDYNGYKVVSHGGGYDGMISKTVLVPELNLGFVLLTNSISSLPSALTYEILDEFCGVSTQKDWISIFLDFKKEDVHDEQIKRETEEKERVKNTSPSLSLNEYTGTYFSEIYGEVRIAMQASGTDLLIDFVPTELFKGRLSHWHYDTFELIWTTQMMLPKGKVTFLLGADGKPNEMRIDVPNPDFDFTELKLYKK
ncbi:MAG: serine hydrolase [Crocinitomicaceae bacterium]|nr:serine hydrolase [Crocinitomicaceae bacterium]